MDRLEYWAREQSELRRGITLAEYDSSVETAYRAGLSPLDRGSRRMMQKK